MNACNFEGFAGRECGEHRTTGERAWCFDCSEWCYPGAPCVRCLVGPIREKVEELWETGRAEL